jgi:phosphoheptose isomerase
MERRAAVIAKTLNGNVLTFAEDYLRRSVAILASIAADELAQAIEVLTAARDGERHVFICGNGGSASTASHFAAGLSKEGSWERPQKFRALSLTDNVAWITSLANDTDFTRVFVEQLKNHAEPDDVLVVFSGSGNSRNVLRAVVGQCARARHRRHHRTRGRRACQAGPPPRDRRHRSHGAHRGRPLPHPAPDHVLLHGGTSRRRGVLSGRAAAPRSTR